MMQANYVVLSLEQVTYRDFVRVFERYHGIPWQILETKRCRLREFCMDDLDDLFALYAKPHVTDFIEPLYEYEQERLYEETYIERIYGFYGFGMWLVFEEDSGKLIGRAGLKSRERLSGRGGRTGLSDRAGALAKRLCHGSLSGDPFLCKRRTRHGADHQPCGRKNLASRQFLEKMGFQGKQMPDEWIYSYNL